MTRLDRTAVALAAVAVLAALAGCSTSNQTVSFHYHHRSNASHAALSQSGYQTLATRDYVVHREKEVDLGVGTAPVKVKVTNWLSLYEKNAARSGGGRRTTGVYVVFSSPTISSSGTDFNPIGNYSNTQIVTKLRDNMNTVMRGQHMRITEIHQVGHQRVVLLGQHVQAAELSAVARTGNASYPVYIHVAKVKDGGDYVVAMGFEIKSTAGTDDGNATYRALTASVRQG